MNTCQTPYKCRIMQTAQTMTCAYYPPIYNSEGVNMNPDRNTIIVESKCLTCNKLTKENK